MPDITYVGASTWNNTDGLTTATQPPPVRNSGDLLLALVSCSDSGAFGAFTVSAGWTEIFRSPVITPNGSLFGVFYRFANATTADEITVGHSYSRTWSISMYAFRNVDTAAPIAGSTILHSSASLNYQQKHLPSLTTPNDSRRYWMVGIGGVLAGGAPGITFPAPYENGYPEGNGQACQATDIGPIKNVGGNYTSPAGSLSFAGSGGADSYHRGLVALRASNVAPNTPTSLAPSGAQGKNSSITLSAIASDPDGGTVNAEFQTATNSAFTTGLVTHTGSTVTSGSTSSVAANFTANTTYYLRARAKDAALTYSGYTATQTFITNRPPAAVAVTAPNGGEVWNASHTITWTGGADPDGQVTTADVELSTNGGTSWSVIIAGTPNDGSQAYDFTNVAASTACKVRIRAKDSLGAYGPYDESNANFTVQHNVAPSAPTLLNPSNSSSADLAAGFYVDWTPNDADPGDTQSAWYIRRKIAGAGSYEYWNATTGAWQTTEIKNPSQVSDYTFPAAKWVNGNTYNWSVATEDEQGLKGPYATDFTVVASAGATVAVTEPLSPVTDTSKPMVAWSLSDPENDPQQTYQVSVFTVAETAVTGFDPASSPNTWGTGEVTDDTARNQQILVDLINGTTYRAYVRVKTNAQYSAWVYREFSLSLTPPSAPTLDVTYDEPLNRMELVITGTHDTVAFPDVHYVAEFSDDGGASWETVRDAGNLDGDTAQVQIVYDYEAPAWLERLYKVRSVANL